MTLRLQNLMLAMLLALTTLFVGFGTLSQNPTSGGYQLFERATSGISADIQLGTLGNFAPPPESASEYANATNTGLQPPAVNPTSSQIAAAERLGVDPRWVKADGSPDWPPNYGFDGPPTIRELQPGQTFDRYGGRIDGNGNFSDRGSFVAPDNVPFDQRSLPDSSLNSPYRQYEVLQPIPQVNSGPAAPWFGRPGGGTQHQLPMSIDELLDQGFIRQIN